MIETPLTPLERMMGATQRAREALIEAYRKAIIECMSPPEGEDE